MFSYDDAIEDGAELLALVADLLGRAQYRRHVEKLILVTRKLVMPESRYGTVPPDELPIYRELHDRKRHLESTNRDLLGDLLDHGSAASIFRDVPGAERHRDSVRSKD